MKRYLKLIFHRMFELQHDCTKFKNNISITRPLKRFFKNSVVIFCVVSLLRRFFDHFFESFPFGYWMNFVTTCYCLNTDMGFYFIYSSWKIFKPYLYSITAIVSYSESVSLIFEIWFQYNIQNTLSEQNHGTNQVIYVLFDTKISEIKRQKRFG